MLDDTVPDNFNDLLRNDEFKTEIIIVLQMESS